LHKFEFSDSRLTCPRWAFVLRENMSPAILDRITPVEEKGKIAVFD
jgi:hypothetical protein